MTQVSSKWLKYMVLRKHTGVAKHLPAMRKFSTEHLRELLNAHHFVVAKPTIGSGGHGLIKITRNKDGSYQTHYRGSITRISSWDKLLIHLHRIRKDRSYLLQQGIHLKTIGGREVDYRVKMVKEHKAWRTTAVVGRVARPGLFVTNLHQGGQLLKGTEALRRSVPARDIRAKKATMIGVARTCTFLLEKQYPGLRTLGYDFGIDSKGRVWIFEVNTRPQ